MKATAIIGAGWGDEGKGLVVDWLAAQDPEKTLVVRHSGGAQSGHTVQTPDGRRHAFGHHGAGSFVGAATFLSRFFMVNPLLWSKEREQLLALGIEPKLMIDPRCLMTTPWDMLINQAVEAHRGDKRHGSCGIGVNETVERCANPHFSTHAGCGMAVPLKRIRDEWFPMRLRALGVPLTDELFERANSPWLMRTFVHYMLQMQHHVVQDFDPYHGWNAVVFEGSQGLLLDEKHRFFPHVTRTRTGIVNACTICAEWKIDKLQPIYVTRAYMTRHGAGPFPTEDRSLSYPDLTNAPNPWQGTLRFGKLDFDLLRDAINNDHVGGSGVEFGSPTLAVTCLDQVKDFEFELVLHNIEYNLPWPVQLESYGPTRKDLDRVYS